MNRWVAVQHAELGLGRGVDPVGAFLFSMLNWIWVGERSRREVAVQHAELGITGESIESVGCCSAC